MNQGSTLAIQPTKSSSLFHRKSNYLDFNFVLPWGPTHLFLIGSWTKKPKKTFLSLLMCCTFQKKGATSKSCPSITPTAVTEKNIRIASPPPKNEELVQDEKEAIIASTKQEAEAQVKQVEEEDEEEEEATIDDQDSNVSERSNFPWNSNLFFLIDDLFIGTS